MAWFEQVYEFNKPTLKLAHMTDCHLFAYSEGEYFGVNTAKNFAQTLDYLAGYELDGVIFGGDLTQDHSKESYDLFAELVTASALQCPVFWLPGNHDELTLLSSISQGQISPSKRLLCRGAEVLLINSKGATPAGWCEKSHLLQLNQVLTETENSVLAFCHHHPVPINGYLDKHILENGPSLLNTLVNSDKVVGLIHGHVHNEYETSYRAMSVVATPATSIQFSKFTSDWQQDNKGPAVRLITLSAQQYESEVIWLNG